LRTGGEKTNKRSSAVDPDWIRIGFGFNPDAMRSLDPYPDCESGSGSRWVKMAQKNAGCSLLRAEGLFCSLDVLYGGLGISKLKYLITRYVKNIHLYFFQFLIIKPWIRIWIWIHLKGSIRIQIQ
jgi:hypothetical protein